MSTKIFFLFAVLAFAAMACNLPLVDAPTTPTAECESCDLPLPTESVPAATLPPIATTVEPITGFTFTCNNVSLVIPEGMANNIECNTIPAADPSNAQPWELAPQYTEISIIGYNIPDHFHQPKIRVYPAPEFSAMNEGVGGIINDLDALLPTQNQNPERLPFLPLFNAGQVFHAQVYYLPFQNGNGVRYLTEFAQYYAPINNYDMIYTYQGLTSDGQYYVSVILPIHAPQFLAMDSRVDSPVPSDGVPSPATVNDAGVDFPVYYTAVTDKLNSLHGEEFNPTIFVLDQFIQSITVTP